jgi:hypothetical protein
LLTYQETIWKKENGFKIRKVQFDIKSIQASETVKDQRARIEKLSLVAFLNKKQKRILINASRRLKRNDSNFYQNSNLHVTVLGFGPLDKTYYKTIQRRIQEFSKKKKSAGLTVNFNTIRPGTLYSNNKKPNPLSGPSNGTVIALGHFDSNKEFCNYSNRLALFLLKDKTIKSVLGSNFRKKLPSVWCTIGYYNKPRTFRISQDLEYIFKQYDNLGDNSFKFYISEISLVRSSFKNLRNPTILYKFKV